MAGSLRCALTSVSLFCSRHVTSIVHQTNQNTCFHNVRAIVPALFHTGGHRHGLMDFFDVKKNWGEEMIKTGRPWRVDELRIKDNSDLHKLWYVLLKERNMLLTMEHEYAGHSELFPNPERIDKVEESMENITQVIKERDEAFNLLETGKSGDPGGRYVRNFLGLRVWKKRTEHLIPSFVNKFHRLIYPRHISPRTAKYLALYREQQLVRESKFKVRQARRRRRLEEEFPHLKGKLKDE